MEIKKISNQVICIRFFTPVGTLCVYSLQLMKRVIGFFYIACIDLYILLHLLFNPLRKNEATQRKKESVMIFYKVSIYFLASWLEFQCTSSIFIIHFTPIKKNGIDCH